MLHSLPNQETNHLDTPNDRLFYTKLHASDAADRQTYSSENKENTAEMYSFFTLATVCQDLHQKEAKNKV